MSRKHKPELHSYRVGYYYDGPDRRHMFSQVVRAESLADAEERLRQQQRKEGMRNVTIIGAERVI